MYPLRDVMNGGNRGMLQGHRIAFGPRVPSEELQFWVLRENLFDQASTSRV